jgi:hypothetical protein
VRWTPQTPRQWPAWSWPADRCRAGDHQHEPVQLGHLPAQAHLQAPRRPRSAGVVNWLAGLLRHLYRTRWAARRHQQHTHLSQLRDCSSSPASCYFPAAPVPPNAYYELARADSISPIVSGPCVTAWCALEEIDLAQSPERRSARIRQCRRPGPKPCGRRGPTYMT